MKIYKMRILCTFLLLASACVFTQTRANDLHPSSFQQKKDSSFPSFPKRKLRYSPNGKDFVIVNGHKRYNRALYGTHTSFRIEAGDLPEFALYFPGIGGDLKLGIVTPQGTKWFNDFDTVETRYRPGSMLYRLKDHLIHTSEIHLQLLAMSDREGMVLKLTVKRNAHPIKIVALYGGASGIHPHRNGDLGADPRSLFYLTPEHAQGNKININKNTFSLQFKDRKRWDTLSGIFPKNAQLQIGDAGEITTPLEALNAAKNDSTPVLVSTLQLDQEKPIHVAIQRKSTPRLTNKKVPILFSKAKQHLQELAGRVRIQTPDPFLNTLGGAISIAADAIWQSPAYLHGAVAWRMHIPGWRGAYVANDLGWHQRAKTEFSAYNQKQLTTPDSTIPFPSPKEHLARQKEEIGVGIFNSGYINRKPTGKIVAHHYDMNLVYIDIMMRNFFWTGDTSFIRQCWPVIKRHLAWEKRNFDIDNNGLFDAYACIWASDALQYSGGDVTYSSAYNYFENKTAAKIAQILGEDPTPYLKEAQKIKAALNNTLWLPNKGWYAEFKDRLGEQKLHSNPGLWTIYHAIDKQITTPFQAYQALRYIDNYIPHIPIESDDLEEDFHLLSTSNWMPYTWSVNNVAMAEIMHTALAYWEGNRKETAFKFFKSIILESMYMGSSPGNFEQLSYYDRFRGELYRDFADPIGISSRALVEGLFGIRPNALLDTLTIQPGFPKSWNHAAIHLPDIDYSFKRKNNKDTYLITPSFYKKMNLQLVIDAPKSQINTLTVNGQPTQWKYKKATIGKPKIIISIPYHEQYKIEINWGHNTLAKAKFDSIATIGDIFKVYTGEANIISIKDPQDVLSHTGVKQHEIQGAVNKNKGPHTLFINLQQGEMNWWEPINIKVRSAYEFAFSSEQPQKGIQFKIRNNSSEEFDHTIKLSSGSYSQQLHLSIPEGQCSKTLFIDKKFLTPGTNKVSAQIADREIDTLITNWGLKLNDMNGGTDMLSISSFFNEEVDQIFNQKYLSPRPQVPTLQLPIQGIGNWCSPLVHPEINSSGLKERSKNKGYFDTPMGVPFRTPSSKNVPDILFTSQWENYPKEAKIPLKGRASHAYFMMAGSTNPMQSRITNGKIIIHYTDGTKDILILKNPTTWWPISQDYLYDSYAFYSQASVPWRVHLQTGIVTRHTKHYKAIKGLTDLGIEGGAATLLDMPLNENKDLASLELKTVANDIVIGLMSITLIRKK